MKGRVALDSVRAVEFVDLSAFNLAHTMQVGHPELAASAV